MTPEIEADAEPEPIVLGIHAAVSLFDAIDPVTFAKKKLQLERLVVSADDRSWAWSDGTPGGDALDLLERFGSLPRDEWIQRINAILRELPPDQQQVFTPGALTSTDQEESFPVDALPTVLKDLSQSLAEVHGVPPEFPATVAMTVAGAAVGRGLRLKTVRSMTTYANLYVLVGMRSGLGKSTVMKPICAPFLTYEGHLQAEHAKRLPEIEAELAMVRKEIAKIIQKGAANGAS
jgi:Protein of unknown function (DUF3987)